MKNLNTLIHKITRKINITLTEHHCVVEPDALIGPELDNLVATFATCEMEVASRLNINVADSSICGSYLQGRCQVERSVVHLSEIRGDALKKKGDPLLADSSVYTEQDEMITISDSYLNKVLIHHCSHNPETPEEFFIRNTLAADYSTINGSTVEGAWLNFFSTLDKTIVRSSVIGYFCYINTGELLHHRVENGTVWYETEAFRFLYTYPEEALKPYVSCDSDHSCSGVLAGLTETLQKTRNAFPKRLYERETAHPFTETINRFAVIDDRCDVTEEVAIRQRVYLENVQIGPGSVLMENSCVQSSTLKGAVLISHGCHIKHTDMEAQVFTGINCFLNGRKNANITIGTGALILPHTIIDPVASIHIPEHTIIWGLIRTPEDLEINAIPIHRLLSNGNDFQTIISGRMTFEGNGEAFVNHLLQEMDSIFNDRKPSDQKEKMQPVQSYCNTTIHILQPYANGPNKGMYPTIRMKPNGGINTKKDAGEALHY